MAQVERWTGGLACALQASANMTNERFAEWLGVAVRTVAYWRSRPETVQGQANQELLSAALGRLSDTVRARFEATISQPSWTEEASTVGGVVDIIADAANSVVNDPLLVGGNVASESVESLQEEIRLLSRAGGMAALDVLQAARRLRDEARALTESARRPRILADLYAAIGQGTALMASTAFDLGRWNESAALARASTLYADVAGHSSLGAWTYGLQMTLANWRHEPDVALAYFLRGMRVAPAGEPRFRLRYIASRSHALLGDAASVAQVLKAAERDRDDAEAVPDDLSRSVGGEFAFDDARAAACAAAAWLDLKNGDEAVRHAQAALAYYGALPAPRRPYSQINGTHIDIAAAHLHMGDRDAALASLAEALELPVYKRNVSLSGRMANVRNLLSAPPWCLDPEARKTAERVSVWLAETSARSVQ